MKRLVKPALVALLALSAVVCSPEANAAEEKAAAAVHNKTLWEQIYEGGWVMIPIGICSVLTVYLCGDGWIRTSQKRTSPPVYETELKRLFREGDYVGAYNFCKANPAPMTNVFRSGIGMLGEGKSAVEEAMVGTMHQESSKMNSYISYLSVIGVCTPMIGLLGTVTGMIKAFANLGTSGIGDPSGLSAAIGEVLIATASGLLIAIPAFTMFYFLRSRASHALHHIQDFMQEMFRKMPYDHMSGLHISGEEVFASMPNWIEHHEEVQVQDAGHEEVAAH